MKKALLIAAVLFVAVVTTACINNIAVQELNNKAAEFMQKGDYESAMNRLQASLDLDSTMYETYYNLGIAATKAGKFDKAIEAFENGIKVKSDYPAFYYSLGVAQINYSESLLEETSFDEKTGKTVEIKIDEETKQKAEELRQAGVQSLTKYLELNPNTEDRQMIEELINPKTTEAVQE